MQGLSVFSALLAALLHFDSYVVEGEQESQRYTATFHTLSFLHQSSGYKHSYLYVTKEQFEEINTVFLYSCFLSFLTSIKLRYSC